MADRKPDWTTTDATWYRGTKEELVEAGVCKAEWIPDELQPELRRDGQPHKGKSGKPRLKRTYTVPDHPVRLHHKRDAYANEFWYVEVFVVSAEEKARRKAEAERLLEEEWAASQQRRAQEVAEDEAQRKARLDVVIRALPPFVPGSMSNGEAHFMRMARAIDEKSWDIVVDFVERMLTSPLHSTIPSSTLRLVVSNTKPSGGR